ncbi:hypothetical protein AB0D32_19935 [Micromonospora sp. NPDC048170]|uniref:hypothetical protein n=1 Tax=Micromonospora sp. NPDC048170 TaxID=3154819 RepID=UPI0033E94635
MKSYKKIARVLSAAALATAGSVGIAAAPAQAAQSFDVCVPGYCSWSYTQGAITWHNRTAGVTGSVVDVGPGSTTAFFEAFAGSTKIDSQTRTADDETSLGSPRGFNFTIGDTDLVGGINRIKITVCFTDSAGQSCSSPVNYNK